jgi:hypothetical protein
LKNVRAPSGRAVNVMAGMLSIASRSFASRRAARSLRLATDT